MSDLLATKLYIPRARLGLVLRPRLTQQLRTGIERKLTLVTAPAGFGKTTLLSEWITQNVQSVCWVSLDEWDNDPGQFWAYFIAALQTRQDDLGMNALALLQSPQSPQIESILTPLLNEIAASSNSFTQVLDDYQAIQNRSIHKALLFLIEHLPPNMHLVIASRTDPPLPLARLRAQDQMTEIRAGDLRFTLDETRDFLNRTMGLLLSTEDIDALERRTEGWIAGLQLAALAMQRTEGDRRAPERFSTFVQDLVGSNRYIMNYLVEEVLSRRPEGTMDFLLQTSILERLCGPLCDAVLGDGRLEMWQQRGEDREISSLSAQSPAPPISSRIILERLEQANLFITPLDNEGRWYRYHQLFAQVLRAQLSQTQPELLPELHRRAAQWFEQNGLNVDAIHHALAGEDYTHAGALIEQIAPPIIVRGQIDTALGWFEALPDELMRKNPSLCLIHSAALMFTNRLEAAEARLVDGERYVQAQPDKQSVQMRTVQGKLAMTRATLVRISGDLENCIRFSRESLELLPENEVFWRASPLVHAASAYLVDGDVRAIYEGQAAAALAPARAAGNLFTILRSITNLARLQALQGRLHQAAATYGQVLEAASGGLELLIGSAAYFFGLGCLLYEWNDLEAAGRNLAQGVDMVMGTMTVDADLIMLGYLTLARLQQSRHDADGAQATLDNLTVLADQRHFVPSLHDRLAAAKAQARLVRGDLWASQRWAETCGLDTSDNDLPYWREAEYLTLARVRITQGQGDPDGRILQDALHLLDRLLAAAEASGRTGSVIEILGVRSLAFKAMGEGSKALADVQRALILAEPEGYIRAFVDQGERMGWLIDDVRSIIEQSGAPRGPLLDYIKRLLVAFKKPFPITIQPATSEKQQSELVETLSEREIEVLHLIAAGASNWEIAQTLTVALSTVKRHTSHIYGKLGVNSRTQAIARAQEHGLL
jgi:LuxR family transcriptional regulator, maltose regulon positive regulatory protein